MDGGAWWAAVRGVAQSRTRLSDLAAAAVIESESEVAHTFPTLCNPMDCSLPGSSVHGILQQEYWSGLPFLSPIAIIGSTS